MKKRLTIAGVLICMLVAAIGVVLGRSGDRLQNKARKDWKANAIAEIARRSGDSNSIASEVKLLRTELANTNSDSVDWLSQQLLLMRNEEWMVYANKCSKEDQRIHDIFIGRGSDGKWYYSTFHFCIRMVVARGDDQPESLAVFAKRYFLVEFDGHSDECLQLTWPPKRK
jgi:hypothetical protein